MNTPVLDQVQTLWVYLAADPLLHLTLTLSAFLFGKWLYERAGRSALVNPVLIAVLLLSAILLGTGTDYATYFEGAQFVHFLLGPATVALAIPLYRQLALIRRSAAALSAALLVGAFVGAASGMGFAWIAGAGDEVIASTASKSVTTPVAMAIAEQIGGLPALTAIIVILTGITGASLGPVLLTKIGVADPKARGVALGTGAHGIGTAQALEESEVAGAFSGLAMGLNALLTAMMVPLLWWFLS